VKHFIIIISFEFLFVLQCLARKVCLFHCLLAGLLVSFALFAFAIAMLLFFAFATLAKIGYPLE